MHNINVHMAPLIEDLQMLWKGVATYDVMKVEGHKHFTLRTILMWTIHDYLTCGLQARCVHYYTKYPTSRPYLTSRHSLELGKVVRNYYNYCSNQ